jgi:UDP-N-acetylmuramate--alanine ligase
MGDSTVISVAGTHGKTTTTALCILGLTGAGEDPSYVVGGTLLNTGTGSYQSTSELFVVEADESDGSFRQYPTTIAVITGVEADHLDNWETESNYIQGFVDFASGPTVTHVVLCYDDPGARGLIETIQAAGKTVLTYGTHPLADLQLTDVDPRNGRATLTTPTGQTHLKLRVHGLHNLLNATASCGVGHILGLDQEKFLSGVGSFLGTHRRFQTIGEIRGITVIDDYAHHPTEVEATIAAAKLQARGGKIIVCFQPHLYSRTLKFSQEFGRALADAGEVVVLDVYPAREEPIDGVTGDMVAQEVKRYGTSVHYVENMDDAPDVIARLAGPSDLVITMGAGSVTQLGPRILCALEV